MARPKTLSQYKQRQLEEEQKEVPCGILHASIEEAMVHAEKNLGFRNGRGELVESLDPVLGTMFGSGSVVGWQVGTRKRFRVDFEPEFVVKNAEAAKKKDGVSKGTQGVHVNEENFTRTVKPKTCHPTESSLLQAELLWRRWSSRYGRRGQITKEDISRVEGAG
jgi:hypothetical protein